MQSQFELNRAQGDKIFSYAIDKSPMMAVRYKGSGSSCIMTSTATTIVMTVDGTADTNFGTAGTLTTSATYTTLGVVVDYINTLDDYEAIPLALRATVTNNELLADATGVECKTKSSNPYKAGLLFFDSSAGFEHCAFFTGRQFGMDRKESEGTFQHELHYIRYNTTFSSGSSLLKIYKVKGKTETLIHTEPTAVTATLKEIDFVNDRGGPLVVEAGHGLLLLLQNSAVMSAVTEFLVKGKSFPAY